MQLLGYRVSGSRVEELLRFYRPCRTKRNQSRRIWAFRAIVRRHSSWARLDRYSRHLRRYVPRPFANLHIAGEAVPEHHHEQPVRAEVRQQEVAPVRV
jgi:hypothetical protein